MSQSTSSPSHTTLITSPTLSPLHIRLKTLEKEHQWLLKQIKRKRTELNNFVDQIRSLATEIFHRGNPSFRKQVDLDREIHTLFAEIFTTRTFGKKTKKNIEGIYRTLQLAGIISPKFDNLDGDTDPDEPFETDEQEDDFSRPPHEHHHQHQERESPSATRTDASRKIRQTFLRLAEIFHPDKVADRSTQMQYTEIMKEVNKAYQEGDLARLLEIEQQHQVGKSIESNSEDDLTRKCTRIEQENQFLKTQYKTLKQELTGVKNTPEGVMVSDLRKVVREGIDPVAQMLEQVESEIKLIADLRDFVRDFRDHKMTIKEFLHGPEILRQRNQEALEDLLEQMF